MTGGYMDTPTGVHRRMAALRAAVELASTVSPAQNRVEWTIEAARRLEQYLING